MCFDFQTTYCLVEWFKYLDDVLSVKECATLSMVRLYVVPPFLLSWRLPEFFYGVATCSKVAVLKSEEG